MNKLFNKPTEIKTRRRGGKQRLYFFKNGYGASVINGFGAYVNGGEWELAVLEGDKDDSSLTYKTPITDDVIGHLSENEVEKILNKIKKLNKKNE